VGATENSFRRDPYNGWILLCRLIFYPLSAVLARRRFSGYEHLQVNSGVLLVANHVSHIDPVYDAVFARKAGRWPRFMAKASLWKVPVLGTVMRGADQIPVERAGGGAGKLSLDAAEAALRDGKVVIIYPEGTITRDPDTWPMRPKAGAALLALSGDFPVVPMVNWGTNKVFVPYVKKGRIKPLPRKDVIIRAGPPIDLSAYRGKPVDARLLRDVTMLIMEAVRDLVAEERGEQPPQKFFVPKRAEVEADAKSDPVAETVAETAADPVTEPDAEGSAAQ
jgi:1-acyl-sn-glycerol-3-phosphate acyltransferase